MSESFYNSVVMVGLDWIGLDCAVFVQWVGFDVEICLQLSSWERVECVAYGA